MNRSLFGSRFSLVVVCVLVVFLSSSSLLHSASADFAYSYWVLDHPDGSNRTELHVSVSSSLYDYFVGRDHSMYSAYDFGKFVTPYALKPIADSLWTVYSDDEDFANGVLMVVHQIPYVASAPQKYPVESIAENQGDCDLDSFVTASIMMAGGLDVVLLFYESAMHMNVGVNLSHPPNDARSTITYFSHNGRRYYVAETTGDHWETGWRVGEYPDDLQGSSAQVITLEDAELVSPGQVSASFGAWTGSSTISLSVSSGFLVEGSSVSLTGSVSPVSSGGVVTIYVRSNGGNSSWTVLGTVPSDSSGRYSYDWKPASSGLYYLRANWSGDAEHAGADSNVGSVRVVSLSLLFLGIACITLVAVALVVYAASRRVGKLNEYPVPQ